MSNTPEFNTEQLAAARSAAWRQDGNAVLTLEAARDFVTTQGLMLFTPRSGLIPAPASSFVEATMGAAATDPAPNAIVHAQVLLGRLISEGSALALNLLGGVGDSPDFIVSAQAFSFLYTLRGDKNWKQPPATTGATKSSPLGVRIYEVLTEKGALSATELAAELGRELTESAVLRALTELWSNLRVLPLYGQEGTPVVWELATRRFTKAIKSGVNAGQPTALSALLSLYLGQALLATEEEIEVFLSPLAARSRIREVTHVLTGSRQLEIVVIDGKSLLHIPGTLPAFPAVEQPVAEVSEIAAVAPPKLEGEGRIKRFTPSAEQASRSEFKGKPARSAGARPPSRFGSRPDAERRPFKRDAAAKTSFTKPWEENRKPRAPRADGEAPRRPYKPRTDGEGPAPRPYVRRDADAGFAPRRPYTPRTEGGGFAAKRPYAPREDSGFSRPARPAFGANRAPGDKPAYRKSSEGFAGKSRFGGGEDRGSSARKPFTPGKNTDRPDRKPFAPKRAFGDKPVGDRPFRKFDAPKRPFVAREDRGGKSDRPAYGGSNSKPRAPRDEPKYDAPSGAPKRPFPRKAGDLADRPVRPWPEEKTGRADGRPGGFGSKPRAPRRDSADRTSRPSFGTKRTFSGRPSGDGPKRPFKAAAGGFSRAAGSGFSKRAPSGGKVPFGSKPPRGVNPRTANRAPYKRKPESEE